MNLVLWIARLVILLIIIRFVVVLLRQALSAGRTAGPSRARRGGQQERIGGTLVQDPHCGTYVAQDRAVAVTSGGATHYFCSAKCRDEWARHES